MSDFNTSSIPLTWTQEKYEAFAKALDNIQNEIKSRLGNKDVSYVKRLDWAARLSEVTGRLFLHFSIGPISWLAGVFFLWLYHQIDTIEIGHSALHGCWDGLKGAEKWSSDKFYWNAPVDEKSWQREHNILHHQYTNVVGKDPDLSYGNLRMTPDVPWYPGHFFQLFQFIWTAPFFMWIIGSYATGLADLSRLKDSPGHANILPDRSSRSILNAIKATFKKWIPYTTYHFVFWPLLAWPHGWKVLLGNIAADVIRSLYTCFTIYSGHFGDDLKYYPESFRASGRGEWYKAQVEAAHNFKVPKPITYLCGALDYQIEHHLFPKLPPNRLREISGKVENICQQFGVYYARASWGKTLKACFHRILKMSTKPANS